MTANWFVPCRRAVLTGPMTHCALIDSWCEELERHEGKLRAWYGLTWIGYQLGLTAIRNWQRAFFPNAGAIAAVRDGEVTVDSLDVHFKPRLWKGPQRVLREAPMGPEEPEARIFDPLETDDPRLVLTPLREIDNAGAQLLMGDVVELPLFRFLVMAGRGDYGAHALDPEGSYLLGTSLTPSGIESPPLHDNLIAMRFQTLLGCMVGSFYHPEPVIDHEGAVSAPIPKEAAPPPPPPVEDPRQRLLAEARRVYDAVSFSGSSIFQRELAITMGHPDWSKIDAKTRDRLIRWSSEDWSGHPPPRVPLWSIHERFADLDGKTLSDDRQLEVDLLLSHHERVLVSLKDWATELEQLLAMSEWGQVGVQTNLFAMQFERHAALSITTTCPPLCQSEHSREEVSTLVKALRETVRALEEQGSSGTADDEASDARAPAIYARGMLYACTLYPAAHRRYYEGPEVWHFFTNQWGRDRKGAIPKCLPYRSGLNRLPRDQPVTPGGVCSDTTLLLLNYMVRNHGEAAYDAWGAGAVGPTMRERDQGVHYPIHDYYEYVPSEEVATWAPTVTREEKLQRLGSLIAKVRERHRDVAVGGSYCEVFHGLASAEPGWSEVGDKTRERLAKYGAKSVWGNKPPWGFFYFLSVGLKYHDGIAYQLLSALHTDVIHATRSFIRGVEELVADDDWKAFADVGSDLSELIDERTVLSSIPMGGFAGRYDDGHALAKAIGMAVWKIRVALEKKLAKLEKLAAKPEKIEGSVGGRRDLSELLGDVNTVSYKGHEWAIVRVRDAADLMDSEELPRTGFISAFHPLSGQPYFDATSHPGGQLYVFEETGSIQRRTDPATERKHAFTTAGPFVWEKIPGNEFNIFPSGSKVKLTNVGRTTSKSLKGITRLANQAAFAAAHEAPMPLRPLLIHPTTKPSSKERRAKYAVAFDRLVTNGPAMYVSRALPYPTLNEARHAFATWEEVDRAIDELGALAP